MSEIFAGLLIGAFTIGYIANTPFRHYVNVVLIFFLNVPLNLLNYIDRGTCGRYYYEKPRRNSTPKTIEPKTRPQNHPVRTPQVSTFKNEQGKVGLSMDTDARLQDWLAKNPELKIFEN